MDLDIYFQIAFQLTMHSVKRVLPNSSHKLECFPLLEYPNSKSFAKITVSNDAGGCWNIQLRNMYPDSQAPMEGGGPRRTAMQDTRPIGGSEEIYENQPGSQEPPEDE